MTAHTVKQPGRKRRRPSPNDRTKGKQDVRPTTIPVPQHLGFQIQSLWLRRRSPIFPVSSITRW